MSLTQHDPLRTRSTVIGGSIDPEQARGRIDPPADADPVVDEDGIIVTCAACDTRQAASGRAAGYTCQTCGTDWRVLRCRSCKKAAVVLEGVSECPRCGHENRATPKPAAGLPAWLTDPAPLSIWLGGAKYLGGHAERDQPISAAGLLLDRRGFHVRAFAELFTLPWSTVQSMKIEGPADISERLTMSRLVALGASTWVTSVAYLTVHTSRGDAIFEIDGLSPPELRARLSRVLQGLDPARPGAPIELDWDDTPTPRPAPAPEFRRAPAPTPAPSPAPAPVAPAPAAEAPTALAIDPSNVNAPMEVLVVDALWKLAQLRDSGMVRPDEVSVLRSQLLARVTKPESPRDGDGGPLLRV